MEILVLDDEPLDLKDFERQWGKIRFEEVKGLAEMQHARLTLFTDTDAALAFCAQNSVDLAFLDINMPGMNGLEMAQKLQELHHQCRIIFLTGYSDYAIEAFKLKIFGYLMKPVNLADLTRELQEFIKATVTEKPEMPVVRAQCFGMFGLFVNEQPVLFRREKVKEMMAFLIAQRGAFVSMPELITVLWEGRPDTTSLRSQLRNNITFLNKILKSYGIEKLLLRQRNELAVDIKMFSCDYYDFLAGDAKIQSSFCGEFMYSYSWGEVITATLENIKQKRV